MSERRRLWVWLFGVLLPVAAVAAAIETSRRGDDIEKVMVAAALMGLAGLVAAPTRSGMRLSPAVLVPAGLPFVEMGGTTVFTQAAAASVVLIGVSLTWLLRSIRGEGNRIVLAESLRRVAASVVYLVIVYRLGVDWLEQFEWSEGWWEIAAVTAGGLLAFMVEVVMGAVVRIGRPGSDRRYRSFLETRDFPVYVTMIASGALMGLSFDLLGWWAIAVGGLPFAFAHGAFRRYEAAQRTYSETIRALARIPEAAGHVTPGHADRTSALAGAVGRRLALSPTVVETVERAGYLHDIGRITLNDPQIAKLGFTENDIAGWGAEIAEEASLEDLAVILRRQYEPYRQPGQVRDPDLPLESRIVKVCSAYDEFVTDMGMSPLEALERLHEGSVYDYDPDIVAAVRSTLEAGGFARQAAG